MSRSAASADPETQRGEEHPETTDFARTRSGENPARELLDVDPRFRTVAHQLRADGIPMVCSRKPVRFQPTA